MYFGAGHDDLDFASLLRSDDVCAFRQQGFASLLGGRPLLALNDMVPVIVSGATRNFIQQLGVLSTALPLDLLGFKLELFNASVERRDKSHLRFLICMRTEGAHCPDPRTGNQDECSSRELSVPIWVCLR